VKLSWPADPNPVKALSPTELDVLRTCPLRMSFRRTTPSGGSRPTAQQALGILCHDVLERMAREPLMRGPDWRSSFELAWSEAVAGMAQSLGHDAAWAASGPEGWPGYRIKLARLRKAAERLHGLLEEAGPDAELACEERMSALDGRLVGQPDLVIRAAGAHWIVDYKSGRVTSQEGGPPRDSYVRQLQLYAVLEHEVSGAWPTQALLLPLAGPAVKVNVDPSACMDVAAQMIEMQDTYNATVPKPQPASPSAEACRWCPYATRCEAFWDACNTHWREELLAVRGVVESIAPTQLGGASLRVRVSGGSLAEERIGLRSVSAAEHPALLRMVEGSELHAVGLRPEPSESIYRLPAWASLRCDGEAA